MTTTIRHATTSDIPDIVEIHQSAFHEEITISQIEKCFNLNTHQTYLVLSQNERVGFADCFKTTSATGQLRLELDLLAIHPDYQGQGIGRKLITHITRNARNIDLIRALVAVQNQPMQKAMTKTGFNRIPNKYALYVGKPTLEVASKPEDSHIIPVDTFSYSGIWLEGQITQQLILATQPYLNHPDDIIGAVVPTTDTATIQTLLSADFTHIKDFHWWAIKREVKQ